MEAVINAAMKICKGFEVLHLEGLSYQDLNDGNFFINPETGDVLICDNDNIAPQGVNSGILGKARYMAPEVVMGTQKPDQWTDRYSLSVILFMLFYGNHPLEGARVSACPCLTEKHEKRFYGSEALFIYDEINNENRPVRGVHNNVIRKWNLFPEILRDVFKQQFSNECMLKNPKGRMVEAVWQKTIQQVRDILVVCPLCGEWTFVENATSPKCICCGKTFSLAGILKMGECSFFITPKTKFYIDKDNQPDIEVVSVPGNMYPVQLKNITSHEWIVTTPSGKLKSVTPNQMLPVKAGLKIKLKSTQQKMFDGEIV